MTREEKLHWAGEYALGLLDGAERAAFEVAAAGDAELSGMAARLAGQLAALDQTARGEADLALWAGIETRIAGVAQLPPLPPVAANENQRRVLPRWAAVAASVVVALGAGYFAGSWIGPTEPKPTVVAVLIDEASQSPGAIIEAFGDDSVQLVPLERFAVPEGQVLQVWTLPDVQTGPVSLGTLAAPAEARLHGPQLPTPASGQLYEITLEPAPGSPTGRPTGPILVKGFAKAPI